MDLLSDISPPSTAGSLQENNPISNSMTRKMIRRSRLQRSKALKATSSGSVRHAIRNKHLKMSGIYKQHCRYKLWSKRHLKAAMKRRVALNEAILKERLAVLDRVKRRIRKERRKAKKVLEDFKNITEINRKTRKALTKLDRCGYPVPKKHNVKKQGWPFNDGFPRSKQTQVQVPDDQIISVRALTAHYDRAILMMAANNRASNQRQQVTIGPVYLNPNQAAEDAKSEARKTLRLNKTNMAIEQNKLDSALDIMEVVAQSTGKAIKAFEKLVKSNNENFKIVSRSLLPPVKTFETRLERNPTMPQGSGQDLITFNDNVKGQNTMPENEDLFADNKINWEALSIDLSSLSKDEEKAEAEDFEIKPLTSVRTYRVESAIYNGELFVDESDIRQTLAPASFQESLSPDPPHNEPLVEEQYIEQSNNEGDDKFRELLESVLPSGREQTVPSPAADKPLSRLGVYEIVVDASTPSPNVSEGANVVSEDGLKIDVQDTSSVSPLLSNQDSLSIATYSDRITTPNTEASDPAGESPVSIPPLDLDVLQQDSPFAKDDTLTFRPETSLDQTLLSQETDTDNAECSESLLLPTGLLQTVESLTLSSPLPSTIDSLQTETEESDLISSATDLDRVPTPDADQLDSVGNDLLEEATEPQENVETDATEKEVARQRSDSCNLTTVSSSTLLSSTESSRAPSTEPEFDVETSTDLELIEIQKEMEKRNTRRQETRETILANQEEASQEVPSYTQRNDQQRLQTLLKGKLMLLYIQMGKQCPRSFDSQLGSVLQEFYKYYNSVQTLEVKAADKFIAKHVKRTKCSFRVSKSHALYSALQNILEDETLPISHQNYATVTAMFLATKERKNLKLLGTIEENFVDQLEKFSQKHLKTVLNDYLEYHRQRRDRVPPPRIQLAFEWKLGFLAIEKPKKSGNFKKSPLLATERNKYFDSNSAMGSVFFDFLSTLKIKSEVLDFDFYCLENYKSTQITVDYQLCEVEFLKACFSGL